MPARLAPDAFVPPPPPAVHHSETWGSILDADVVAHGGLVGPQSPSILRACAKTLLPQAD